MSNPVADHHKEWQEHYDHPKHTQFICFGAWKGEWSISVATKRPTDRVERYTRHTFTSPEAAIAWMDDHWLVDSSEKFWSKIPGLPKSLSFGVDGKPVYTRVFLPEEKH